MKNKDARLLLGEIFSRRLPPDPAALDLQRFPVANYIVFKDALAGSFEASREKLEATRAELRRSGIEPLFMMDEEGGRVTQVAEVFPSAPSPAAIAQILKPNDARKLYGYMAEVLAVLGIDLNLAPCTDVNTEPLNPVIGTRSFGVTREAVERYTVPFVEASKPFIGCIAKHFPGHGMTVVDSHLSMPTVGSGVSHLEAVHIPPFRAALRAGADGIMVGHCNYTAIQKDSLPASLSVHVIGDLLRGKLGFDGLAITDSLDMDAVTMSAEPQEASRAAFEAGADILLYTENSERFERAFESMVSDLVRGRMDRGRLNRLIARRRSIRDRSGVRPRQSARAGRERYLELRNRVFAASVEVEDSRGILPLAPDEPVCVTSDPGLRESRDRYLGGAREITEAEEAQGKVLIMWFLEPLRLNRPMDTLHQMIKSSRISVLVTSYRSIADTLSACDVRIVTTDTSAHTRDTIVHRLFGGAEREA